MRTLTTEFPIKSLSGRGEFVAQVVSWLQGVRDSNVLSEHSESLSDPETAYLSCNGEELRIRELRKDEVLESIGFRHDLPDNNGRLWRTEVVVCCGVASAGQDLVRLRTQCIARDYGVVLDTPRKPYLIKTLLKERWGGRDGGFLVTDDPIWLSGDASSLQLANDINFGKASIHLPIVYISSIGLSRWTLTKKRIEQLAFDLGGVAHVVVEPNRAFSYELRNLVEGFSVYGGAIGVSLPGRGIVRRINPEQKSRSIQDIYAFIKAICIGLRTDMPSKGWDWTELQEQALRRQRERDKSRLSAHDNETLYLEEIENLKDKINQLNEKISFLMAAEGHQDDEDGFLKSDFVNIIGKEIYPGEFSDRLRMAAKTTCDVAEQVGLDRRSQFVLKKFFDSLMPSHALRELLEDIGRATKDSKRMATELVSVLGRYGYVKKSENNHIRLEAKDHYPGLDALTVPKTPSEIRGLQNMRKQVERTLGITKLSD